MALKFRCPKCQTEIIVQHLKPGETAKCRQCGNYVVVPAESGYIDTIPPGHGGAPGLATTTPGILGSEFGPKDAGQIISDSFAVYKRNFIPLLALSLVFQIPLMAIQYFQISRLEKISAMGVEDIWSFYSEFLLGMILYFLFYLIFYPIMMGGSLYITAKFYAGLKYGVIQSLRVALGRMLSLLGVMIVSMITCMIIAVTIIGIPVSFYLAIAWSFAFAVLLIEQKGVFESIKGSYNLIRNNWWRVLGAYILMGIIGLIICLPCSIINYVLYWAAIVILTPLLFTQGMTLYLDLRARKEGYNKESLRKDLEALDIAEGETPAPSPDSGPMQMS